MANTAFTQQALAADPHFHIRVRAALATVAFQVINENPATTHHVARATFATNDLLPNLASKAQQISPWLVQRTNLFAEDTSYDFAASSVVTTATDAEIESQIATDFNVIAGIVS